MNCGVSGHAGGVAACAGAAGVGSASAAGGFVAGSRAAVVGAGGGASSDFGAAAGEVAGCCTMAAPKTDTISTVKGSAATVALRTLSIRIADVIRVLRCSCEALS